MAILVSGILEGSLSLATHIHTQNTFSTHNTQTTTMTTDNNNDERERESEL